MILYKEYNLTLYNNLGRSVKNVNVKVINLHHAYMSAAQLLIDYLPGKECEVASSLEITYTRDVHDENI